MTFINPRAKVLAHLDRLVDWRRGLKPAPVTVEWDLSNRCTLGCQDCHFAHTHVRGPWAVRERRLPMAFESTGDLADTHLVNRALAQMSNAGVQGIVWSGGGEPTTHPDWMHLTGMAKAHGFQQGMYTHGGLLTKASSNWLALHVDWVVVSLDAVDAETYALEKGVPPSRFVAACDGVRHLVAAQGAVVGVSFLLHAHNWQRAEDMLALSRSLGATYTTFRPTIQTSPDRPGVPTADRAWISQALATVLARVAKQSDVEMDLDRFEEYAGWAGHGYTSCEGVQLNTTITPDGRVWLCPQRRGVTALGDLRTESFADIWARHPGRYQVDAGCRVMCRLHPVNEMMATLRTPRQHEAFV